MIKLENRHYNKAIAPLSHVKINTMFAEAVIRQRIPGTIYVDCVEAPSSFYVVHPYGMSLLFGNTDNEYFQHNLYEYITNTRRIRNQPEWLQVAPEGAWTGTIDSIINSYNCTVHENTIIKQTRVNFSFDLEAYQRTKKQLHNHEHNVMQTTKEQYLSLSGSVTPKCFWRDADQFLTDGIAYSLLENGEIASTAFSAFRNEHQLEIGIETSEAYRGKGYAYSVCSALIDYCLNNQLEPVWACRLENEGSYKLAQRLGFTPSITIPYYRLAE
ncbi:GNAT family N-acetyltransferase [Paenibacillus sp. BR2-3]|uniref:GNAT family N-acetyltransferase n=1 Tax=Paenibacillus sp. BR2-3 TaxID=3048494 RepID=UPI00397747E1